MLSNTPLYQYPITVRLKRHRPRMPPSITAEACGDNVLWRVRSAIASRQQMLGSGAQVADLAQGQPVGSGMGVWIGQPHWLAAVKAQATLVFKGVGP